MVNCSFVVEVKVIRRFFYFGLFLVLMFILFILELFF